MRRSIASARRLCTITKRSVDPLDQTEGGGSETYRCSDFVHRDPSNHEGKPQ